MAKLPHQSSVPPVDPQDGAIKSDGGAAESLQTTTADVVVSGAAAPTAGQVLTAIDGVSADWQDAAAGGAAPVNASVVNTESANFYDTDDQFASVADPGVFQGLTAMTIECWFTLDRIDGGFYGFCGQAGIGNSDVAFTLRGYNTGTLRAEFSTDGGVTGQAISFSHGALAGEWAHVAVTWDGATGNARAYINGVLVAGPTALVAGAIFNSSANFNIGRYNDQNFNYEHYGKLSELRIWGVVRTAGQILDSLYGVAKGNEDGLVTVHHLSGNWRDTGPNSSVHLTPDANAPTFVKDLPFDQHTVLPARSTAQNTQSYNFIPAFLAGDYLFRTNPGIFGGHAALSIECWLKPVSALVIYRGVCAQDTVFRINAINATQIEVGFSVNGTIVLHTITPGWAIGEWTHLSCTWEGIGGGIRVYVDGVLTGGVGIGPKGTSYQATTQFTVGFSQGIQEGWDGNISELRIWKTQRSVNQILDSMHGAMSGGEEGLIVLYHLNGTYRDSGPNEALLSAGRDPVLSSDVPHGPQAYSLLTSGGAVDIAASAPPTAGQGLIADSPTTASWQDIAAGTTAVYHPIAPQVVADLDGTSDYAGIADGSITGVALDGMLDLTAECWIRRETSGAVMAIMGKGQLPSDVSWYIRLGTGDFYNLTVSVDGSTIFSQSSGGMNGHTGKWVHVAMVRNGTTGSTILYANGVQVFAATSPVGALFSSASDFRIGAMGDGTEKFDGTISQVRIWNVLRTTVQIVDNMRRVLPIDTPGLLAFYPLDNDWDDKTVNANHLTPVGSPPFVDTRGLPFGVAAHGLVTRTSTVVGSAADAPTAGQVATAIDADTFDWQTPVSGGAGSDTTAIHDDTAGEINAIAAKAIPVAADVLIVEDSAASFAKKKIDLTNLLGGVDAIHDNVAGEINAIATKATPVAADVLVIEDSEAAFVKKKIDLTDLINSTEPVAAAQGAYIQAGLSTPYTTTLTIGAVLPIDSLQESRRDLEVDTVTNVGRVSTLKAGRTYYIYSKITMSSEIAHVDFRIYDVLGAGYIGLGGRAATMNKSATLTANYPATHIFTPLVDTEIEIHITGFTPSTVDIASAYVQIIEIGAVQANVVGGLEFMDTIDVTVATASVSFGASGDGAFQRALDGDVDNEYVLVTHWKNVNQPTTTELLLRPNGLTTNQDGNKVTNGVVVSVPSVMPIATTAFDEAHFSTNIKATTGGLRSMAGTGTTVDLNGGLDTATQQYSGVWSDISINITSLEVITPLGSHIGVGSTFSLYRRTRTNLRADSAAVYERMSMETVDPGALATTERTVGHTVYGGSLMGVSLRVEDAVTAGDITVNVKLDGVVALTAVLDATNPSSRVVRAAAIGDHEFAADKNISVEFVPTSYDNAGSIASAVTVQVHLTNDSLISPPYSGDIAHVVNCGDVNSNSTATPKIVSQFMFDPTDYDWIGASRSIVFRSVASNGGGAALTKVQLYSLTDAEVISTLDFTSVSPSMAEEVLVEGAAAGEVDQSAKIYEVRIWVDSPDLVDDTVELGSAELRIANIIN